MIYCKDNLELLKELPDNYIDLIYCDVLFGTNKKFENYEDRLGSKQQALDFYIPRIEHIKRTLKPTGLFYLHCDYNLSHYLKITLDNIFGEDQFRNEIIWFFNSAPRKKSDFGKRHNTIFRYSKTDSYYFDDTSSYVREAYSPTAPRGYEKEKYYHPLGKVLGDVWKINILGQNDKSERIGYSTQKPESLLYPIIDSSCPFDGLVADFFCGSGTTLVVAKRLGRRYLGCDINPFAVEITEKRLLF